MAHLILIVDVLLIIIGLITATYCFISANNTYDNRTCNTLFLQGFVLLLLTGFLSYVTIKLATSM